MVFLNVTIFKRLVSRMLVKLILKALPDVPKKYFIFGTAVGYRDNSKFLFEESIKKGIKNCYWVAKNRKEYFYLKEKNLPVVLLYSHSWFKVILRTKVAFFTHGIGDLSPSLAQSTIAVNLWHCMPLKKMGYDAERDMKSINRRNRFGLSDVYSKWDFILASNTYSKNALISATHMAEDQIIISKQARNAPLYGAKNPVDFFAVYMPTHRDDGSGKHIDQLVKWWPTIYEETGMKLCIKQHPLDRAVVTTPRDCEAFVREYDVNPSSDPQDILIKSAMLISDYSSVIFDYLILRRPIVIFAPDVDRYLKARGGEFYIKFEELFSQFPMAYDRDDFITHIIRKTLPAYEIYETYSEVDCGVNIIDKFMIS